MQSCNFYQNTTEIPNSMGMGHVLKILEKVPFSNCETWEEIGKVIAGYLSKKVILMDGASKYKLKGCLNQPRTPNRKYT